MQPVDLKAVAQKWVERLNNYGLSPEEKARSVELFRCMRDLGFDIKTSVIGGPWELADPIPQRVEQGGKGDE